MAEKEKKEVTIEDLQKQIGEITQQVTSLTEENKSLKDTITQKDLQIAKLSLGGREKQVTKVEQEDEDINFDFDF